MIINILGSKWKLFYKTAEEDTLLEDMAGYTDWTTKTIVVENGFRTTLKDSEQYQKKVVRHEIIHAYLFESGLYECSSAIDDWATNEEMVDWFAFQAPKIYETFKQANVI